MSRNTLNGICLSEEKYVKANERKFHLKNTVLRKSSILVGIEFQSLLILHIQEEYSG